MYILLRADKTFLTVACGRGLLQQAGRFNCSRDLRPRRRQEGPFASPGWWGGQVGNTSISWD